MHFGVIKLAQHLGNKIVLNTKLSLLNFIIKNSIPNICNQPKMIKGLTV